MSRSQTTLAGWLLILAAITFWISWFLMPDQGTADTYHILTIVKESREAVFLSVIIQILSSVLYLPALFLIAQEAHPQKRTTLAGLILLSIGAMGMCADAFFHLLAYFMTDPLISIQEDVVMVMQFMQTQGIVFLIPLLLPFFIGSLVLAIGLQQQAIISKIPQAVFIVAFVTAISGAIIVNKFLGYGRPFLALTILGLFATGQLLIGQELLTKSAKAKKNQRQQSGSTAASPATAG